MAPQGMSRDVLLKIISQFESKGVDQAKKSLLDLGKFDKRTFLGGLGGLFKGMVGNVLGLMNPLRMVHGLLGTVGKGVQHLGGIFKIALGVVAGTAINTAVSSLRQLATEPVMVAARVGALEAVFDRIGQQAGHTKDQLAGYVEALKETGITTRQSLQNLLQMVQANLDLSKATDLARVAQDAAVIAGTNSSEAFGRLLYGITSLQPRILRSMGIIVDMQGEVKRWAAAHDMAASEVDSSTKQMIAFEAVMRAGQTIAGSYESAMTQVGKKLTSLPRYIEEAQLALGRGLTPILSSTVDILGDVLKKAKDLFEGLQPTLTAFSERVGAGLKSLYEKAQDAVGFLIEGFSKVRPYLQQVGDILGHYLPQVAERLRLIWIGLKGAVSDLAATISTYLPGMAGGWTLFTDSVKAAFDSVLKILDGFRLLLKGRGEQAAVNFTEAMANGLALLIIIWEDYVSKAVTWGYNLVAQFASGMISAASEWVTTAVEYVGNLIQSFFASFSPPKKGVLAGIVTWGKGLINEYFKGFTQADFGILDQVGGAIKNALQSAVALGDLPEKELIPLFREVRTQVSGLIADFRKTGEIGEEALSKIGETLGEGSEDLVEYLRLQLEHQKALKDLGDVAEEYAEAEAAGFVPAELKERLAAAQARAEETEEELSWQEALVRAQQDGLDLQVQQVRVLQKLAAVLDKMSKAPARVGKKPKADEDVTAPDMPALTMPEIDTSKFKEDIDAGIAKAFEGVSERFGEAKEKAKGLMGSLVEGAREALAELPGTIRAGIGQAFEVLREKLPWIDTLIAKFNQFKTWWNESWPTMLATILTVWTTIKATIGSAVDVLVGTSWPHLQEALSALTDTMAEFGVSWSDVWSAVKRAAGIVAASIGALLLALVAVVVGVVNGIATALEVMLRSWQRVAGGVKKVIEGVAQSFAGAKELIAGILTLDLPRAWTGFVNIFAGQAKALVGWWEWISGVIGMTAGTILGFISGLVEGIIKFFENLKQRLVGGSIIPEMIEEAIGYFTSFRDQATKLMEEARAWITDKIGGIAESFTRIRDAVGEAIVKLGEFLTKLGDAIIPDWLMPGSATPFEQGLWGILGVLGQLGEAAQSMFVFQKMREDLAMLVGEGGLIPLFVNNTIVWFTELGARVSQLVMQMKDRVVQLLTEMVTRGIQLITMFITKTIQLFTEVKNRVVQLITEMVQSVLEALRELRDESEPILEEIAELFTTMADRMDAAISKIIKKIGKLVKELEKLKKKAGEVGSAMGDAGLVAQSPSLMELALMGINSQMGRLNQRMGFMGQDLGDLIPTTLAYQQVLNLSPAMRPVMAAGGGGTTFQLFVERFEFPSIRTARDAGDFWEELQSQVRTAEASAGVPGGVK